MRPLPSETMVDRSPNYKVLEQKVLELQGQMEEMQMSRRSYEDSNARLAGFLSGFTSQLSLGGESGVFWDQEEVEENSEEKRDSRRSFSAMPNQVWQLILIFQRQSKNTGWLPLLLLIYAAGK